MSRLIRLLWAASLPGAFVLAGIGMLWLYTTLDRSINFYDRMIAYEDAWVGSHMVLFASTILMVPAAIAMWKAVEGKRGTTVAGVGLLLAIPATFFLAGQYAIDFIMPLVARAGEGAYAVHRGLFDTQYLDIMFYNVPDVGSIGFLLLTIALALSGIISRANIIVLGVLWIGLIGGNILGEPLVARASLLALGFAFVPVAQKLLTDKN